MDVAAFGTRLAALSGVELGATLSARLEFYVSCGRTLSTVAATVLTIPFGLRDAAEIPIGVVAHINHFDTLLVSCNP